MYVHAYICMYCMQHIHTYLCTYACMYILTYKCLLLGMGRCLSRVEVVVVVGWVEPVVEKVEDRDEASMAMPKIETPSLTLCSAVTPIHTYTRPRRYIHTYICTYIYLYIHTLKRVRGGQGGTDGGSGVFDPRCPAKAQLSTSTSLSTSALASLVYVFKPYIA